MALGPLPGLVHHPPCGPSASPVPAPQLKRQVAQSVTLPIWAVLEMLRALVYGLTILHLGPGIAFALLAFGCEEPEPYLRFICGKDALASFAMLSVGAWAVLLVGLAAVSLVQRARRSAPPNTGPRAIALLAVVGIGVLLGAAGNWLTGSQHWFLAVPGALAVGWLFIANPLACAPAQPSGGSSAGQDSAA